MNWEEDTLTLGEAIDFGIQFCTGMIYLHQKTLLNEQSVFFHGDIKPENLLIDTGNVLKITDFGLTQIVNDPVDYKSEADPAGTPRYVAPERFQTHCVPNVQSDIFSFGVVLYEMFAKEKPFDQSHPYPTGFPSFAEIGVQLPQELNDLVMACLREDPSDRPGSFETIRSILLQAYLDISSYPYPTDKLKVAGFKLEDHEVELLQLQHASYYRLGAYDQALSLLDHVLEIQPGNLNARYNKGLTLLKLKRYPEAIINLESALNLNPGSEFRITILNTLAYHAIDTHNFAGAVNYCNEALAGVAGLPYEMLLTALILTNKGNALRELKQVNEALHCYNEAIRIHDEKPAPNQVQSTEMIQVQPQEELAWYNRGVLWEQSGHLEKALFDYNRSILINPYFGLAWSQKGLTEFLLSKKGEASVSLKKAAQLQSEVFPAEISLFKMADELQDSGAIDQAAEILQLLTDVRPDVDHWWASYGHCFLLVHQYRPAVACYDQAIRLGNNHYTSWLNRALALYELADYQEALHSIEEVLRLVPDHANAQTVRQMCLKQMK